MSIFDLYVAHVQSADKLDERRDVTVRTYGGVCAVVVTAATGLILEMPFASLVLWALLIVVATVWKETLESLSAKLKAKADELREMEKCGLVEHPFLTNERRRWESLETKPLQVVGTQAPNIFRLAGLTGIAFLAFRGIATVSQCI